MIEKMNVHNFIAAFMTAWAACYDPVLSGLSWPRYPLRELRPKLTDDGNVILSVAKFGYGYKYRGPRPREPPAVDVYGIKEVLNTALEKPYQIREVQDQGRNVLIIMEDHTYE